MIQIDSQFCENNADLFRNVHIRMHHATRASIPYPINAPLFDMLLMNIMINAVTYNESAHPRIDIHFLPRKKELQIRFEDNGIGIPKSEIKKIFRMFYQVGHADDMTSRGSGLGLYMVQQIARLHKGKVTAASEGTGKGSVFTLMLPLRQQG